jgi:hypothetical protein
MMTPRERAEEATRDVAEWDDRTSPEDQPLMLLITEAELTDVIETAITEHVRAVLADDEAMIEAMAKAINADIMENATRDHPAMRPLLWDEMGLKNRDDYRKTARAALAALRSKAGV